MKCYIGYTACRFVVQLIDYHSNCAGSIVLPYGDIDNDVFRTDARFMSLKGLVSSHRSAMNRDLRAQKQREAGLNDVIEGHMNKHYLKMKYREKL